MNKMHKKGADKILSVYWFAILIIVAGGIVFMVVNFYGYPYDVREIEAEILVNKVVDCLSEGEKLNKQVLEEDFLENCNLKLDEEYYLEVLSVQEGNSNLKDFCELKNEKSIVCVERNFYAEQELIKVLGVVRKTEQNVK